MTFCRSGVIVMPAAATSHWPVLSDWPDWMPSNAVTTTWTSRSLAAATLSIRSMSKPTISFSFSNSKGW